MAYSDDETESSACKAFDMIKGGGNTFRSALTLTLVLKTKLRSFDLSCAEFSVLRLTSTLHFLFSHGDGWKILTDW